MKSYTDLEQSRKLTEILPIESADMCWTPFDEKWDAYLGAPNPDAIKKEVPCWSLASLLDILPNYQLQTQDDGIGILCSYNGKFNIVTADNPVDACVAMIEKLNELNLL